MQHISILSVYIYYKFLVIIMIHLSPLRLPPFSAVQPAMCFAQAEAQFTLASISSNQTKLCYVILQMDHWYATEVEETSSLRFCDHKLYIVMLF